MIFSYGQKETEYLSRRDKKLGDVITRIGMIERGLTPDLFSGIVESIIGQQISTKAQRTICARVLDGLGVITPATIVNASEEQIQSYGISFRKVSYIKNAAEQVLCGELDIDKLVSLSDKEVCEQLSSLRGIGVWTAEMLMIFSMQRMNILSYGDMAIQRGLRMLYHHKEISVPLFEKYRRRYSPYCSVASMYLWAVSGGSLPELKDPKNPHRDDFSQKGQRDD